ncbi:erythromycin esterase [Fusarium subglutinans]|uniref:Erythromycin esterase n=1 Tax=Gibberella subglutinans TaxID=42677 RepID=A0A8H5P8I9_GIBSU|nr:erythromycin esterase [Fusarium subglutinans]KAF5592065.1 erythromycin esterase [Fusarium subglutinans]
MFETLTRLLEHRGRDYKPIVWSHNSHVGDARATSIGWSKEEINIGDLCKKRFGAQALSTGTGTNTGTVAAAQDWDGNMNIMELQARLPGSYEEFMHAAGIDLFVLDLRKGRCGKRLREILNEKRLEGFISLLYIDKSKHVGTLVVPAQGTSGVP